MDWRIQFSLCMIKQYLQQIGQIVATLKKQPLGLSKINKKRILQQTETFVYAFLSVSFNKQKPFLCIFVQGRQQPRVI